MLEAACPGEASPLWAGSALTPLTEVKGFQGTVSFTASGVNCSAPGPLPEGRGDGEGAGLLSWVEEVWAGQARALQAPHSFLPFSSKDGLLTLSLLF